MGKKMRARNLIVEVTTSPSESVGRGDTLWNLIRMCHCHCHCFETYAEYIALAVFYAACDHDFSIFDVGHDVLPTAHLRVVVFPLKWAGAAALVTPHTHLPGDPCLAHVLPSDMSSVQSSFEAERVKFAMVGPANGCSRGAIESMSEIPVIANTTPLGEDYGDHRECTLDALTPHEVSGAAAPVSPHKHLLGDLCPAHSLWLMAHVIEL